MLVNFRQILFSLIILLAGCGVNQSEGLSVIKEDVPFGEKDYEKIVSESNELGFKFFKAIEQDQRENLLISPVSLYMLLSMISNGVAGTTKEELVYLLGIEDLEQREINEANASLLHALYTATDQIFLHIGQSLWLKEEITFQRNFTRQVEDYFNGDIQQVQLQDPKVVKKINKWVQESTNGKIKELLDGPLDERMVTLLINALYFNGAWQYAFDHNQTEKGIFYSEENQTNDVYYMKQESKLPYFETEHFQAVSLPYGDGEMSMNIFLPKKHEYALSFMNQLTEKNWKNWQNQYEEKEGTILLPKFTIDYEINGKIILKKLGLVEIFQPKVADFSKMIEEKQTLFLDEIKQKTFIEVHEEGTEAAAITSAEIKLTSASLDSPFYMKVNRPFFFMITDNNTGAHLFIGAINTPMIDQ